MKKFILIMLLCLTVSVWAITPAEYARTKQYLGSGNSLLDPLYLHMVDALANYSGAELGTGDIYYCDSSGSDGAGTTWATAKITLKGAIGECTGNAGDIIYVAQGHAETVSATDALDADVAGITIIGLGSGDDMPQITFVSATGAELTISDPDVTIYNIRFLSNYEIAAGIHITADGDGARIIGCQFRESSSSLGQLVMINVIAAADDLVIVGNSFVGASGGADTSAIVLLGASDRTVIADNHFYGDWSGYVILASGATSTEMLIKDNVINNLDTSAGYLMTFATASTGSLINNKCYSAGSSFVLVGDSMFVSPDNVFMYTKNVESRNFESMIGAYTGAATTNPTDNIARDFILAQVDLDAILANMLTYDLDHLSSVADGGGNAYPDSVVQESVLAYLMDNASDPCVVNYDNTAHSLKAIGTDTDSLISNVSAIAASIAAMNDTGYVGRNVGTSTTVAVVTLLKGFGENYFNTGWSMIIILNEDSNGNAPEGQIRDIITYETATGTFTLSYALTSTLETGDRVMVKRTEDLELDIPTILGGAGRIFYLDSGATNGDATALTWENASLTLAAVEALMTVAGDVCYIADGHDENANAGAIVLNIANTSFIGLGEGNARPLFTCSTDGILFTIDNAGITVKNLRLQAGITQCDNAIRVESAGIGVTIDNIAFIDGDETTVDEFVDVISVDQLASNLMVKNCTYYSLDTTNDVASFLDLSETTIDSPSIIGCTIFGDFSDAAIWGDGESPVNVLIKDNVISNTEATVPCIDFNAAATGVCSGNRLYSSDYGTNGEDILDPGSMICIDNWATDAINQQAIRVPLSATTDDVTAVGDGSDLERLEYLQNKSDDILAGILMAGGTVGDVYYCNDGGDASGDATTWATAETVLADAYGKATASVGDIIFVAPAHAESIASAQITLNIVGVTIIGIGDGAEQPQIEMTDLLSSIDVTAADNTIKNINFYSTTDEVNITIDVDAAGFVIEDCLFTDTGDFEHSICIDLDGGAEEATIRNCTFETHSSNDAATACINQHTGVINRLIIEGNSIFGTYSGAAILSTQVNTNCLIQNNSITNNSSGVHCIELSAAMTGELVNNRLSGDKLHAILDPGSMRCFENYASLGIDSSATLIPPINSTEDGPGQTFYCDSGSAGAGDGKSWNTAVLTLDAAINLCSTGRGDTIHVATGHAEPLVGATSAAMDLAGVKVIGHGVGDARPTFTFTTAIGATIAVTAADCTLENLILYSNWETGITAAITASNAADGLTVDNVEFRDNGNTKEMFAHVSLAAACDDVTVKNCFFSNTAASPETLSAILAVGAIDNLRIFDNRFHLDAETACILGNGASGTNLYIADNTFFNIDAGGLAVLLDAGTTGIVVRNLAFGNVTTTSPYTVAGCMVAENYGSGNEGQSGIIYPAVE